MDPSLRHYKKSPKKEEKKLNIKGNTNLFALLANIFPFTLLHVHQELVKTVHQMRQKR